MLNYSALNDAELLIRLKDRDQAAFTEIYDRYWSVLYLHVRNLLRQEEEARDIVQELFTSMWQKTGTLQPNTSLSGYLYRSVRNRVFDHIRRRKVVSDYVASLSEFLEQGDVEADALLREKELSRLIEEEIGRLPKKMRVIFEMSRKEHLSYQQIARELGVSEHTVKSQVSNALRELRSKLGPGSIAFLYFMEHLQKH
jgi:RNA polymerase sigma-70 factor (ECF subfamily)